MSFTTWQFFQSEQLEKWYNNIADFAKPVDSLSLGGMTNYFLIIMLIWVLNAESHLIIGLFVLSLFEGCWDVCHWDGNDFETLEAPCFGPGFSKAEYLVQFVPEDGAGDGWLFTAKGEEF